MVQEFTVHWYLGLEEGMTPEETRNKAAKRKITENPHQRQNPKKRGANQIIPKQGPEHKKRKFPSAAAGSAANTTHTSYAEAASLIKVAVLPREPQPSLIQTNSLSWKKPLWKRRCLARSVSSSLPAFISERGC